MNPPYLSKSSTQLVAEYWEDLRKRWAQGDFARAEEYLTPEFRANCTPDDAVDIVYAEYVLAEQYGGQPQELEFFLRFPEIEQQLRQQFTFHHAFENQSRGDPHALSINDETLRESVPFPRPFGRYILIAPLDEGGQSRVFRAVHPDLSQEIVLKIARRDGLASDSSRVSRSVEEARILASLSHPNLARVFDAGTIEGDAYLALEYVRGQTLSQWYAQRRPLPDDAAKIVATMAKALAEVHAAGVLHLDIKPNNIVLDTEGEPRLLDFGLSRQRTAWSRSDASDLGVSGTLEFMAPEQTNPVSDQVCPATDIFALGGVLYFLLTGKPLYTANTLAEAFERAYDCDWDRDALIASKASKQLVGICKKALAKSPADRFASATEFSNTLDGCIRRDSQRAHLKQWGARILLGIATVVFFAALLARTWQPLMPAPTKPIDLTVRVWNQDNFTNLAHAVPLRNGDELEVTATIPPQMGAVLMLVTSENRVRQLKAFPPSLELQQIRYPDETLVPMTGNPGTEFLLILAGREPFPTATEIESFCQKEDWPRLPDYSILRLTPEELITEQIGKDFGAPTHARNPESLVRKKLEALRQYMKQHCQTFEGIAFSHSR
ncbi:serine/threonine protein kinase [Schlesneria paludicola]|uniref:serine/threonine protein kinase n=1 Tax=Schlesneria paludicola TaxID=360056 RepID=UPI00029A21A9|nr:serine/threonine-protein kinase [Schlesneria paludicola]